MNRESQVLSDIAHQLRGPLAMAVARLNRVIGNQQTPESLELLAVRGLCMKANRIAETASLFSALSSSAKVSISKEPIDLNWLTRMLIEQAANHQLMVPPERKIIFSVDRDSLGHCGVSFPIGDPILLEQAVSCLLDNAIKYSYPGTTVRITSARTKSGSYRLTVSNMGIPISENDAAQSAERGWRGREAQAVTGEGTGLGLWLADNIMRAHEGLLRVNPTDEHGITAVDLILPQTESVSG